MCPFLSLYNIPSVSIFCPFHLAFMLSDASSISYIASTKAILSVMLFPVALDRVHFSDIWVFPDVY